MSSVAKNREVALVHPAVVRDGRIPLIEAVDAIGVPEISLELGQPTHLQKRPSTGHERTGPRRLGDSAGIEAQPARLIENSLSLHGLFP